MNARAIVGAALTAGLATTTAFSACRGSEAERPAAQGAKTAPPPSPPAPTAEVREQDAAVPDAGDPVAEAAARAERCTDPHVRLEPYPDAGVVFNNAMTSVDAGFIDRTQGVLDAIAQQGQRLACCFDAYLREHPQGQATLVLRVRLAPDGEVSEIGVIDRRSNVDDPIVRACAVAVARSASFPPSPTHKETIVEYPLRASPREATGPSR